jgi:hypothetical protein
MFKTQGIILADPAVFSHSPFVLAPFGVEGVEGKDNAETQSTLRFAEQKTPHHWPRVSASEKPLSLRLALTLPARVPNTLLR